MNAQFLVDTSRELTITVWAVKYTTTIVLWSIIARSHYTTEFGILLTTPSCYMHVFILSAATIEMFTFLLRKGQ